MEDSIRYGARGVSATKSEVHAAINKVNQGLFPKAFCKIYPDYLSGQNDFCNIIHADGAGTKSILAYLYWKETGDLSVWKGIAQDAIVMNTDDLLCAGATNNFIVSSIINRNKHLIPGEVLKTLIDGTEEFLETLRDFGININLLGGETADVGDAVRTVMVDAVMSARFERKKVISNENIVAGDVIVGLSSSGTALYEKAFNSGIGSNGLTSARHDVLSHFYAKKYNEAFDPLTPEAMVYCGSKMLEESLLGTPLNIGEALLSPTRTYLPILKPIIEEYHEQIHGIIHCSGGGQTKILHYIDQFNIVKNNLFPTPALFKLIREESKTEWKEMYQVFNMGHRMELYVPESLSEKIITHSKTFGVDAKIIGHVEQSTKKMVSIKSGYEDFTYE
ncbi:MAG: phosphoribosylformylglycinamidine cyclo-ligase [Bacteroidetes bacterium]|nr:phosphoribosylformylglycinamidine cyclo-ligase [Bacteroidota bacterium]